MNELFEFLFNEIIFGSSSDRERMRCVPFATFQTILEYTVYMYM